jgi:hypothetical protein
MFPSLFYRILGEIRDLDAGGLRVGWTHMFEMRYTQGVRSCSQGSPSGIGYFGHFGPKLGSYSIQYLINI